MLLNKYEIHDKSNDSNCVKSFRVLNNNIEFSLDIVFPLQINSFNDERLLFLLLYIYLSDESILSISK